MVNYACHKQEQAARGLQTGIVVLLYGRRLWRASVWAVNLSATFSFNSKFGPSDGGRALCTSHQTPDHTVISVLMVTGFIAYGLLAGMILGKGVL